MKVFSGTSSPGLSWMKVRCYGHPM